jgi:hypothetical protein
MNLMVRFTCELMPTLADVGISKVAKYGDTSATYWKLYGSEAEAYDKKYIESLRGNISSMVFLVRDNIRSFRFLTVISYSQPCRTVCSPPSSHHLSSKYTRISSLTLASRPWSFYLSSSPNPALLNHHLLQTLSICPSLPRVSPFA